MNKKQWVVFIVGIVSVIVSWITAFVSRPYGGRGNMFWTLSYAGGHFDYYFNFGIFVLLIFLIIGVFAFVIWILRTNRENQKLLNDAIMTTLKTIEFKAKDQPKITKTKSLKKPKPLKKLNSYSKKKEV